ncbi:plasmid segregation protein ParM domain-containing protein [Leptospirillum ferriphilum]|uniref:Uncharacterized protein n=1 Tax=Leptospirillum ferriphilum TaxID=178606 RepID=A0A1V3SVF5_9BACT|nr:ParM/StbA family protein [Leptospirillum ferriphilum]OOH72809.1 hypothetical protein BOX24_05315 [Leptospirillum ferriphilum]
MINVGIDDGYAAVKVAWHDGEGTIRTLTVPSRARRGSYGVGTLIGEDVSVMGFETEGERFTVGPGIEGETTRIPEYNLSSLSRILSHYALVVAGFAGKSVRIASGLPLDRYFRDERDGKKKDEVRIARKVENFAKPVRRLDGGETARIERHAVFAQGLAAVVDWRASGRSVRSQESPVGVVDIGGQTTDVSVIRPHFQADHDRLSTFEVGALDARDLARRRIRSAYDADEISDEDMDVAMTTGKIKIWGKDVFVADECRAAVKEVESQLDARIRSVFGKKTSGLEAVLFVGGGVYPFRDLTTGFPNAVIPECPEFANARGLLKVLAYQESR